MLLIRVDCSSRDLTLVLDSASSVTASDWTKLTSFVGRLVDDLRRRKVVRRVAVVAYSSHVHVALPLADHRLGVLTSLPFSLGHGRNISGALRLTRTEVRLQFSRVVVVVYYYDRPPRFVIVVVIFFRKHFFTHSQSTFSKLFYAIWL